jgi:hypothetical protein
MQRCAFHYLCCHGARVSRQRRLVGHLTRLPQRCRRPRLAERLVVEHGDGGQAHKRAIPCVLPNGAEAWWYGGARGELLQLVQ